MPASKAINAEVVVTYPDEEGNWTVLRLSRFQADRLRMVLDLYLPGQPVNGRENPKAYAE